MNHGQLVPVSDWLMQHSVQRPNKTSFTKWCYTVKLFFFFTTATVVSRCRRRKRFYFSWNLSCNGSSKKFHKTNHVTRCNACWNLFRSTLAHKFQLKVSMCNSGLTYQLQTVVPRGHTMIIIVSKGLVQLLTKVKPSHWPAVAEPFKELGLLFAVLSSSSLSASSSPSSTSSSA